MSDKEFVTLRLPKWLLEDLRRRARRLETYLAERATLQQAKKVKLPAEPHERFGIAPWQVVARLIEKEVRYELRQRKCRAHRSRRQADNDGKRSDC